MKEQPNYKNEINYEIDDFKDSLRISLKTPKINQQKLNFSSY